MDIRDAIGVSFSWSQFVKEMEKRGYTWKLNRKYPALKTPDMERYVRLRSLGKGYGEAEIREKILRPKIQQVYGKPQVKFPKRKLTGLQKLYFSYLYRMGVLQQKPNITEQTEVDAMAKAIEDAIAALQYKDADYTKVDAAIAKANALNKDNYNDFTGVEAAVNAVTRGKNLTEQTEVDAMAKAIEDAIAALQYKDADYTKVDAAIAKANALNKDDYKDFSGVETAVKAVVRGKNITEQSEVDKMAKAIEDAIAALEKKPASTKPGTSDKSPQTGDTSNLALWIALLFISGGAAIGTTVVSRKKKYNR